MTGRSYEHRLSVVISMLEGTGATALSSLIDPLFEKVLGTWRDQAPDISDGVELVRALEGAQLVDDWEEKLEILRGILVEEVRKGCRADELRELLSIFDTSNEGAPY